MALLILFSGEVKTKMFAYISPSNVVIFSLLFMVDFKRLFLTLKKFTFFLKMSPTKFILCILAIRAITFFNIS